MVRIEKEKGLKYMQRKILNVEIMCSCTISTRNIKGIVRVKIETYTKTSVNLQQ